MPEDPAVNYHVYLNATLVFFLNFLFKFVYQAESEMDCVEPNQNMVCQILMPVVKSENKAFVGVATHSFIHSLDQSEFQK